MRLATFNLMHGRSLVDGRVDLGRLGSAIRDLDADVLGLQEVDRGQPRSGNADLAQIAAEALGAAHVSFVPAVVGTPGERFRAAADGDVDDGSPHYGVALISRWPVIDWRVTRLAPAPVRSPIVVPGPGGRARVILLEDEPRVLVTAVVAAPFGPLTVATTHLSFVPGWNLRQLRLVVRAMRELPPPRVLLGDLNLPAVFAGPISGWRSLAHLPTYPAPSPRVQLDHILLDRRGADQLPAVVAASTQISAVSDHRPLLVNLTAG